MDFQSEINSPNKSVDQQPIRSSPAPFDDMLGSLPATRPMPRAFEPVHPSSQQPTSPQPLHHSKVRSSWLWPAIYGGGGLIILILTTYFTYSWQHGKVVNQNNQIVAFNKTISTQLQQITLLQQTVPALVPVASSYNNWTNYTLKNEKASFQYPKTWKLSDTSSKGSDNVTITSLNNFVITITTGSSHPISNGSVKLIGYAPINFVGKFGYFDFVSTANDGLVEEGILSLSPLNVSQPFPSNAQGQSSATTGNFSVTAGYSALGGTGESQTLANANKDASWQAAQLLIESIVY